MPTKKYEKEMANKLQVKFWLKVTALCDKDWTIKSACFSSIYIFTLSSLYFYQGKDVLLLLDSYHVKLK